MPGTVKNHLSAVWKGQITTGRQMPFGLFGV